MSDVIYNAGNSSYKVYLEKEGAAFTPPTGVDASDDIVFEAERVLQFNKDRYIHSTNVIDDFLFWTDGISEPKKIHIQRSIGGTGGILYARGATSAAEGYASTNTTLSNKLFKGDTPFFHTRLVSSVGNTSYSWGAAGWTDENTGAVTGELQVVTMNDNKRVVYVDETHISVIKPAPTQQLHVDMYRTSVPRLNDAGEENALFSSISGTNGAVFFVDNSRVESGDQVGLTLDSGKNNIYRSRGTDW